MGPREAAQLLSTAPACPAPKRRASPARPRHRPRPSSAPRRGPVASAPCAHAQRPRPRMERLPPPLLCRARASGSALHCLSSQNRLTRSFFRQSHSFSARLPSFLAHNLVTTSPRPAIGAAPRSLCLAAAPRCRGELDPPFFSLHRSPPRFLPCRRGVARHGRGSAEPAQTPSSLLPCPFSPQAGRSCAAAPTPALSWSSYPWCPATRPPLSYVHLGHRREPVSSRALAHSRPPPVLSSPRAP
jgi:hypothetical protein